MNYTANIRELVKKILPEKLARNLLKHLTLNLSKYYQWKLGQSIFLRPETSDVNVFAEMFLFKDYNYNLPFTPKTIIDAGANVGYASLWFHYKYPLARIIAIEPESSNYDLLVSNTKSISNISTLRKGLWSKTTKLEIINEEGSKYGFITREISDSTKEGIETCTVTDIYNTFKEEGFKTIDLLKIDIEGAEKEVFSENSENWLKKVKLIIIELHEESRPGCTDAFLDATDKAGFELLLEKGENLVYINKSLI